MAHFHARSTNIPPRGTNIPLKTWYIALSNAGFAPLLVLLHWVPLTLWPDKRALEKMASRTKQLSVLLAVRRCKPSEM